MSATSWQQRYLDRFYRDMPGWVDGTTEFHAQCCRAITAGSRILEIGAGPSNKTSRFLATLGEVTGLDPDPAVRSNESLVAAFVLEGDRFPFPDKHFDACVSNFVCEHIADPARHLSEVRRVLHPGGVYVLRTPNRYHYVALVSSLTPHWFHQLVANRLRALSQEAHDVYPTVYGLNSEGTIRKCAASAELEVIELNLVEKEPSYCLRARVMFLGGVAYERVVNSWPALAALRSAIFATLRRPSP